MHLLERPLAAATLLEEGLAVRFSLDAQRELRVVVVVVVVVVEPVDLKYVATLPLVAHHLPGDAYASAKTVRDQAGSFAAATPQGLADLFPSLDVGMAQAFCGRALMR
ncbi:hypothetical protein [Lysobacter sp. HA35]